MNDDVDKLPARAPTTHASSKARAMGDAAEKFFAVADPELQKNEIKQAWDSVEQVGGVKKDVFGRRAWDKEHYEALAKRKQEEGSDAELDNDDDSGIPGGGAVDNLVIPASQRLYLQRRNAKLDLEKNVGKQIVQTDATFDAQKGGYWCALCQKLVKDSLSWLDHINGKRHQRMMGMNMVVKTATLEEVLARIEELKQQKLEKKGLLRRGGGGGGNGVWGEDAAVVTTDDILEKMAMFEQDAELKAMDRKEKKRRKKEKKEEQAREEENLRCEEIEEDENLKMMREMGLPTGFG
eukprot:g8802.t1